MKTRGVQDSQCNATPAYEHSILILPFFPFSGTALETASFVWDLWVCENPTVYTTSVINGCGPGMDRGDDLGYKVGIILLFLEFGDSIAKHLQSDVLKLNLYSDGLILFCVALIAM